MMRRSHSCRKGVNPAVAEDAATQLSPKYVSTTSRIAIDFAARRSHGGFHNPILQANAIVKCSLCEPNTAGVQGQGRAVARTRVLRPHSGMPAARRILPCATRNSICALANSISHARYSKPPSRRSRSGYLHSLQGSDARGSTAVQRQSRPTPCKSRPWQHPGSGGSIRTRLPAYRMRHGRLRAVAAFGRYSRHDARCGHRRIPQVSQTDQEPNT